MSDNLFLFANNNGGQAEGNGSYRLYDMKIEGDSEGVDNGVNYVDYLDSDGKCGIDTGLPFNSSYKYVFNMYALEYIPSAIFSSNKFAYNVVNNNLKYGTFDSYPSYQGDEGNHRTAWRTDNLLKVFDNGKYYIGNELISGVTSNQSNGDNVILFGDSVSRLRQYQVYNRDILIQDLRPCLDTKGVPCMYDEVSKKYFYNKGTGTFKYKKKLRDFQPVLDSNNIPCLLDKIKNKFYYNKSGEVFKTKEKIVKKLPFIKTDGASYINTKLKPTDITGGTVEIKCDTLAFSTTKFTAIAVFGCGSGTVTGDSNTFGLKNHYNRQLTGFESTETTKDGDLAIYKGIRVNATRESEIYVGAINGRNGAYYGDSSSKGFRIFYFKIWNSEGALIQHLIPAIDENNNIGMYDEVTKTFFLNQGIGTFGYEIDELEVQDKNYMEIEYIESNGTQYIDTGVVLNKNTDIDMTCRLSAMPYYYAGYKSQINTPSQKVSMIIELDFKYANARGGKGNILGGNNFYILEDGTYSLDGATSTNIAASTTKYDKIKLLLNLESKKQIVYVNDVKIGEGEYTSADTRLSVGGSFTDFCSFYTHYINAYKLSDMTPLFLLRPCLGKWTYDDFEYTIPKLKNILNGTEYQTIYGDSLANKLMDYGYDSNYIHNKLKLINLSAVQNPSAIEQNRPQYDKTVYEINETITNVKPNLVASTGATLTMGSQNLEQLNDDDIETATNNGWSLL